ncbi:MAG TPA: phenylalanine--tRNA ligase subunit beta [Bacillota bacterium]|nr:phenylalanine--tRNA ligase subunit beta [Bacillota bacterium]HPT88598.1 phenylalanine--tRNA ligase subunit beta [Bacillota bacterium]
MRVSIEWLKELVDIDCSVTELAERLTMAGIAVEEIEDQAAKYQGIVVAKVLELVKHPHADNLTITKLDAGEYGVKQVITAAKNLSVGDLVPLALSGTILPDGKQINDVMFKEVLSEGMMCSGMELGIEKESSGIWIFNEAYEPGTPVAKALGEEDQVLVLELTANRSDCLGMIGVAREVAAILGTKVKLPVVQLKETGQETAAFVRVSINDPDLCPRYAGRVCRNVKIKPSPEWMQRRLRAAGIRPINNIVDITNYVMMEYNQPLHAFDLDQISGGEIVVRRAKAGEKMVTLDEVERTFQPDNLLITDPTKPLCVAGVMGGNTSEVTDETLNIFLEAAYFNPISVRKTAKSLEMRTESSLRFERGVDPEGVIQALNRAASLMQELGEGELTKGYIDVYPNPVMPKVVKFKANRINEWLGTSLSVDTIRKYLESVFMTVVENGEFLEVTVPSFRRDISHMADLAEEVARLYGYDRIPVTLPANQAVGERTIGQKFRFELRRLLQGNGLSEIITYSLYSKAVPEQLGLAVDDGLRNTVDLMVPLSEEQAVMRTTLAHGMLEALAFNAKRRQNDVAFFEMARVYLPKDDAILPDEPLHLAIGLMGHKADLGWNQPKEQYDFYDIKGLMELIADHFKVTGLDFAISSRPYLHPGQAAEILVNGRNIGYLGQVHPRVAKNYELTERAYLLEVDLETLIESWQQDILFKPLPKFPAVERDLALVLPVDVTPEHVIAQIQALGSELIESVELFDVYTGEQLPKGCRSMAFSLSYRAKDRTLNDAEVQQLQAELLEKLNQQYGAVIRG